MKLIISLEKMLGQIKSKVIGLANNTKMVAQDDPRRITHCLKLGLALTFVSFFYYFRPLYDIFGRDRAIWAILTVVLVFEFTAGAVIYKCINRGIATLLAGALGFGTTQLAYLFGSNGEPIVLGISIFIIATTVTFIRFVPRVKAKYDYGMMMFILTFSLITISGYRVDEILGHADQRLRTILIGCASCMVISIFIFPVWAGEDLQNLLATNLEFLAIFLEGVGGELCSTERSTFQGYRTVLNTKNSEESLANFASWEPGHGKFSFRHPYELYLKIGFVIRTCGYNVEILSNYLNTELQIPADLKKKVKEPCMKMSSQSSKALREIATSLKTMTSLSSPCIPLENSKIAARDLRITLQAMSSCENTNLLVIMPALATISVLCDTVKCVEDIYDAVSELSRGANFRKEIECEVELEKIPQLIQHVVDTPIGDHNEDSIAIRIHELSSKLPKKEDV